MPKACCCWKTIPVSNLTELRVLWKTSRERKINYPKILIKKFHCEERTGHWIPLLVAANQLEIAAEKEKMEARKRNVSIKLKSLWWTVMKIGMCATIFMLCEYQWVLPVSPAWQTSLSKITFFYKGLSDMFLYRYGIAQLCSAPCALLSLICLALVMGDGNILHSLQVQRILTDLGKTSFQLIVMLNVH